MERLKFINDTISYTPNGVYVARLSENITTEEKLFIKLNNILAFPNYFNYNWNSVSDCIRDFSWIEEKGISLVHTMIPSLDDITMKLYLEILADGIKDWKEGEKHYFEVVFPLQERDKIMQYFR